MSPSGLHQATDNRLTGAAKECVDQLTRLRQQAQRSKARRTEATKRYLDSIIKRISISIASLEAWTSALSKDEQTSDKNILNTVVGYFDQLEKYITAARKALEIRLRTRAFDLCIPASRKKAGANERIDEALTKITETIGSLQNQIKTVVVDSRRRSQIGVISSSRSKYYDVFKKDFSRMSSMERQTTRFGVLPCLWNEFPPRPAWDDHIGSAEDPGDGLVYSEEQINLVRSILKDLYEAWSNTTVQSSPARSGTSPKVAKLTEMPKICLVLYGMKQERLLDYFREYGIVDKDLPLNPSTIKEILPDEDSDHATAFSTEQYRAVLRQWDDGTHIIIPSEEPLPLEKQNDYGSGSYGVVTRCKCKFTRKSYARKEQVSREARAHLKREVDRLQRLEHRHIVQFAKSYERGDTYGILLRPAATTDLKKLLKRYDKNGYDYGANGESRVRERKLYKPIILTSFGCLSRGLAQIHSRNIRHRDIKPENILYQKELLPEPAGFLWADFGLAHYFEGKGSKTTTNMQHYSDKYAAPESIEANLLSAHVQRANQDHTHLQIQGLEMEGSHEGSSDISKTDAPGHIGRGRSADIFSFGCVFLETLSHLVDEQRGELDRKEFESCAPFYKHIDQLKAWAVEEMKYLQPENSLKLLFEIGLEMIAREPDARPKIHTIVQRLRDASPDYFCSKCQDEAREDRGVSEKEVVGEPHRLRDQPSVSDSIIKENQADPETRRLLLADLILPVPSPQELLRRNEALPEQAESSSVARLPSPVQPRRSALKHTNPVNPDKQKNTPHFKDLNLDDEDLS